MGKVIHKELKFENTIKCYMHKTESIVEKETQTILKNFKVQTVLLITARRPGLMIINKKNRTCRRVDFSVPAKHQVKIKKGEKKRQVLGPFWRTKKAVRNEGDGDTIGKWHAWNSPQRIGKEAGSVKNSVDNPNYSIGMILQEYWDEFWKPEETCCHSVTSEWPSANAGVKILQKVK